MSSIRNFRSNVSKILIELAMTQAELANKTDMAPQLLSRYLSADGTVPGLDAIDRIAKAMGVRPIDLLHDGMPSIPGKIAHNIKECFVESGEFVSALSREHADLKDFVESLAAQVDKLEQRVSDNESLSGIRDSNPMD